VASLVGEGPVEEGTHSDRRRDGRGDRRVGRNAAAASARPEGAPMPRDGLRRPFGRRL